jgi:hypothetical protein
MREGTHEPSETQWDPWIDATTLSLANRGVDRAQMLACLMRQRRFFRSGAPKRPLVKVERLAVGAVTDRVDAELETVFDRDPRVSSMSGRAGVQAWRSTVGRCRAGASTHRASRAPVDLTLDRAHRGSRGPSR